MKKYLVMILAAIMVCSNIFSQIKAGNKFYDRLAYETASVKYERALRKDSGNVVVWGKIAECYRLTNNKIKAEEAYKNLVASGNATPEQIFNYTQTLMENEKYEEAKVALNKFAVAAPDDPRVANLKKGLENISGMKTTEGIFTVKKTNLNSNSTDFSPAIYNGGVVFTSNRAVTSWVKNNHSWTGEGFFTLYQAKGTNENFGGVTAFGNEVKSKFNDGPVCFSSSGTQMFWTRNNIEKGKVHKDATGQIRLKIFYSLWSTDKWGTDIPFQYNSDNYSCAHPAISADGMTLYFASDMPGGMGGMDIWKCNFNGTSWDAPVNLGAAINTKGNEIFPHVNVSGTLYFASNGHDGLGGLDIFVADKSGEAKNLGSPLNSPDDDFGIATFPDGKAGYFTSNRKGQGKNDDIYYFMKQCTNADVVIVDDSNGAPLKQAEVVVFENGKETNKVATDETGKFKMCLNPTSNYEFKARKSDYTDNEMGLTSSQIVAAAATGTEVKVPMKKKPELVINVAGRVFNQDDKSPVTSQTVTLINKTTGEQLSTMTDANGNYKFVNIAPNQQFEVGTSKKDCGEVKDPFNTNNITSSKTITMDMPLLCKGDIIKIENIYYDYNKYNIRPDAAIELDMVIAVLNKYPGMTIELRSHTDARGKDEYNAKLSDNRAKSAVQYIISKGINKSRLVAKGYGEAELLNHCKNGVECDDKTHEQNRRTEFKILSM